MIRCQLKQEDYMRPLTHAVNTALLRVSALPRAWLSLGATSMIAFIVHGYLRPDTGLSVWIQMLTTAGLGLGVGDLIWRVLQRLTPARLPLEGDRTHVRLLGAALGLAYGRQIFMSFFYNDEVRYFAVVNQNWGKTAHWLIEPLNEHFQPLAKLVYALTCNIWGIDDYFGLALLAFVAGVLLIIAFYALVCVVTRSPLLALVTAGSFAALFNLSDVYQYKAAGFPLQVSISFLLLSLLWIRRPPENVVNKEGRWWTIQLTLYLGIAVFFSSLITLPLFYLLPFLVVAPWRRVSAPSPLKHARLLVLAAAFILSFIYYLLRWQLKVPAPHHLHDWETSRFLQMVGSFAGYHFSVPPPAASILGGSIVICAVVTALLLARYRKSAEEISGKIACILVGIVILILSPLQLYVGRGFKLAGEGYHRYEIFPLLGAFCVVAGAFSLLPLPAAPRHLRVGLGGLLLALAAWSHFRLDCISPWPIQFCNEVNRHREEFFNDLAAATREIGYYNRTRYGYDRMAEFVAFPDFPLGDNAMVLDPAYPLHFYAQAVASSDYDTIFTPFAAPEAALPALVSESQEFPESLRFLHRYYPRLAIQPPLPLDRVH